jgi:transmembrane sensor
MPGTVSKRNRISYLFKKYLNGTCSKDEAQEIVSILEGCENDISLSGEASTQWHILNNNPEDDLVPIENRLILNRILDQLHHRIRLNEEEISGKHSIEKKLFTIFTKAAAVLILPLLVYSIYLTSFKTSSSANKQVVWQTVKTPAGMQTDFLLPDSSHVWLNSGSVFKYPIRFDKDKRQVEMTGEAFFDVVKDPSHPFLVKAGKMNIEVRGTRFNVINYPDETLTELILESGSVRLFSGKYEDNKTIANIKPGQHALLDIANNKLLVRYVDVEKYTAWKEGILIFKDDQMDEVVRKLDRWFNVDIILLSPELKEYVYTATYRNETLPQILELLKISAPIKYCITERERLSDNSYTKRKIVITKRK